MAEDYSFQALMGFLEYASDMGLLKANTAGGLRTAASKVAEDLTEQEAEDVRTIELEQLFQRFVNRNKVQVSPATLRVYRRRLGTAIEEFVRWRGDPTGYKPGIGTRKAAAKDKAKSSRGEAGDQKPAAAATPASSLPLEPSTKAVTLPFPLRRDFLATIQVPRDLRTAEAERLASFIKTLVVEEEPK